MYLFIYLFIYLLIYLFIYLSYENTHTYTQTDRHTHTHTHTHFFFHETKSHIYICHNDYFHTINIIIVYIFEYCVRNHINMKQDFENMSVFEPPIEMRKMLRVTGVGSRIIHYKQEASHCS